MKVEDYQIKLFPSAAQVLEALKKGTVTIDINGYCLFGNTGGILSTADHDDPASVNTQRNHCNPDNINHSIVLVGIRYVIDSENEKDIEKKPCLVYQNSWGTDHAFSGYGYILLEKEGPGFGGIFSQKRGLMVQPVM